MPLAARDPGGCWAARRDWSRSSLSFIFELFGEIEDSSRVEVVPAEDAVNKYSRQVNRCLRLKAQILSKCHEYRMKPVFDNVLHGRDALLVKELDGPIATWTYDSADDDDANVIGGGFKNLGCDLFETHLQFGELHVSLSGCRDGVQNEILPRANRRKIYPRFD